MRIVASVLLQRQYCQGFGYYFLYQCSYLQGWYNDLVYLRLLELLRLFSYFQLDATPS